MRVHALEREQWIPRPLDEVFDFFSRAENLSRITPPWLHFDLRTPTPVAMRAGTEIDYRIRLSVLPLSWRTRIDVWEPGVRFIDSQQRGPYRLWEHLHEFEPLGSGVRMTDRVRYALPFGPLGGLAHGLVVRAALAAIFDYRFHRIREVFTDTRETRGPDSSARRGATPRAG